MGDDSAITCHETLEASKTKLDLLKQEFDSVQGGIARCGDVQFKIKGWAITIFSAFVLIAVQHGKPVLLVACAGTVVLFWLLDSFYTCDLTRALGLAPSGREAGEGWTRCEILAALEC